MTNWRVDCMIILAVIWLPPSTRLPLLFVNPVGAQNPSSRRGWRSEVHNLDAGNGSGKRRLACLAGIRTLQETVLGGLSGNLLLNSMIIDYFVAGQIVLLPFLDYFSGEEDYNKKLCPLV